MVAKEALEALFVANPDFEAIEKSLDVFCPFEAVGMERQEVRHGHFLAYCLDSHRPHGFGSECLRALMRSVAGVQRNEAEGSITPLDVHLMDFEKAQVRRHWRHVDLLVIVNEEKLIVAIELKINSGEHSGQLGRYRKVVKEQWPEANGWRHLFIFLTKDGDEASEEDGTDWITLGLADVAQELDSVVQKQKGASDARLLLSAYLAMLRRHHLTDKNQEELAAQLWSKHREALEFLMEHQPDDVGGLFGQIYKEREKIAAKLTEASDRRVVFNSGSATRMYFAVEEWDSLPDFKSAEWRSNRLMLLEFGLNRKSGRLRMHFVLGPGKQDVRQRYYDALIEGGAPLGKRKKFTDQYTRLGSKSIVIDGDEDQEDLQEAFEKVVKEIEKYAKETIPVLDKALSVLKK